MALWFNALNTLIRSRKRLKKTNDFLLLLNSASISAKGFLRVFNYAVLTISPVEAPISPIQDRLHRSLGVTVPVQSGL